MPFNKCHGVFEISTLPNIVLDEMRKQFLAYW